MNRLRPETWKKLCMLGAAALIYVAEEVIPGGAVRAPGETAKPRRTAAKKASQPRKTTKG